jgi:hypothetical protein
MHKPTPPYVPGLVDLQYKLSDVEEKLEQDTARFQILLKAKETRIEALLHELNLEKEKVAKLTKALNNLSPQIPSKAKPVQTGTLCRQCGGDGGGDSDPCPRCYGNGFEPQ